ncbi:MAG TPA: hypothetical protein VES67_01075 [Vicinamibacterales bacterium]|nr:hypothetical protein [Vicinamibacterales bacterium]
MWSVDAWVLVRPAAAFQWLAAQPLSTGLRVAVRRPLLLTFVMGCIVSLAAAGTLTARLVGPPMLYWAFIPIAEILALAAIVRRRGRLPFAALIDGFFAGHAAWLLLLIAIGGLLAFSPPALWWTILTRVSLVGLALVVVWSAYVDFCFFRHVVGAGRGAALRDVVVHRAITWLVVFSIFATQELTPWGLYREVAEAIAEILR